LDNGLESTSGPNKSTLGRLKELLHAHQWIVLLVAMIVGSIAFGIGVIFSPNPSESSTWVPPLAFGIGTSLYAAAVFAQLYTWIAESKQLRTVASEIATEVLESIKPALITIKVDLESSLRQISQESLSEVRAIDRKSVV